MDFMSFAGSFLSSALRWIIRIFLLVGFISLVYPLLPDDPFRSQILGIRGSFAAFSQLFNWCLPVKYIVSTTLFWVMCKMFYLVYKFVGKALELNFTNSVSGTGGTNVAGYIE